MNHDSYTSLISRHINSIARAEMQVFSFLRCMAAMDKSGKKLTDGGMAAWLEAENVKWSRDDHTWTDERVWARFNINDSQDIERARVMGRDVAAKYRRFVIEEPTESKWAVALIRWLKFMNKKLPRPAATVEQAVEDMATWLQTRADACANELRRTRASYD
jgi:hypothetical protein